MEKIIWLLPTLFMLHDFEEIIFLKKWTKQKQGLLQRRFPVWGVRLLKHLDKCSTAAFAGGVAEEYVLLNIITLHAWWADVYWLWFGTFMVFFLHLFMHLGQALFFRGYIPGVVTSLLVIFPCWLILQFVSEMFTLPQFVLYTLIGSVLVIVNILFLHYCMEKVSV